MWQSIALQDISKLPANTFEYRGSFGNEVGDGVCERIDYEILVGFHECELIAHFGSMLAVLWWAG